MRTHVHTRLYHRSSVLRILRGRTQYKCTEQNQIAGNTTHVFKPHKMQRFDNDEYNSDVVTATSLDEVN